MKRGAPDRVGSWLCLVTDRRRLCASVGAPLVAAADLLVEQAHAAALAGISLFQVREPDLDARSLTDLVERIARAASGALRVVVNDRVDVALTAKVAAHLRSTSVRAPRLREWLPPQMWLSASVHSSEEARTGEGVDALLAGTVFSTSSKPSGGPLLGLRGLSAIVRASSVPVLGIGGLSAREWPAIRETGAAGIAAIGWFLPRDGEQPGEAVTRAAREWSAVAEPVRLIGGDGAELPLPGRGYEE